MKKLGFNIKVIPFSHTTIAQQFELFDILQQKCEQGKMKKKTPGSDENYFFFIYSKLKRKKRSHEEILKLAFKDDKFYAKISSYATIELDIK